jgi:large subunit ribosomal protein L25
MEVIVINGEPRAELGKKGTKAVRNESSIPCVLYGPGVSEHFSTEITNVRHLIYTPDFKVAEVKLNGQSHRCIVKDVQYHPVSEKIMHIDFLRLTEGHTVKVEVPLRLTGTSVGVKNGGKMQQKMRRVKIKTTPDTLITELLLDVTNLNMGQSLRVRDINPPQNVEIMNAPGTPVATIEIPRALRSAAAAAEKTGKK